MLLVRLRRRFFCHRWETTAHNQWFLSTREKCSVCGLEREVTSTPSTDRWPKFEFWWKYSDGTKEPDERIFKHVRSQP